VWLIVFLSCVGATSVTSGLSAQKQVPVTKDVGEIRKPVRKDGPETSVADDGHDTPKSAHRYLPYAEPTIVTLPSIGVTSELISVGKTPDGSMEVPQAPNFDKAAWYRYSPAPGQYGASIIIGHVDSYASQGASVFFNLAKLKPGDSVAVHRADNTTAVFTVRAIREYHKHELPADIIYAPVTDSAELRLITCSGPFDKASGNYENNTVVFATLEEPAAT